MLGYLSRQEIEAILESPDMTTWSGQRDRMMFTLMYNTGVRVSELVSLRVGDVSLASSAAIRIQGKGRKERSVPLWKQTAKRLKEWLRQLDGNPQSPLFANARGNQLSRAGVENRLRKLVLAATARCRSLAKRQVSPHTLRHTTAMHLLESGVEMTVIALWLGHESTTTTHQYVEASLAMKEKALAKLKEVPTKRNRFQPSDSLLRFLNTL
jgi:site-specific recombinase XerD